MDVHTGTHRWLSPSLFVLIGLCFFLPFLTVSCNNASTTFTGIQLVTHTVPHGGVLHEGSDCSTDISVCVERAGAPTATIALAAAAVGLLLGLLGIARGPGWCAAIGTVALVKLIFSGGFLGPDIYPHSGYDLALLFFAFAWLLHIRRAYRRKVPRSTPPSPMSAHVNALLLYCVMALGCHILAAGRPGLASSIGTATLAWLGFGVAPAWLAVAVALHLWQREKRPDLLERAARWDALLWLGPLLAVALMEEEPSGVEDHAVPPKESHGPVFRNDPEHRVSSGR